MPHDRSELATPTLMRAARGTYARSIRAQLRAIGADDLPPNGSYVLFGLYDGRGVREGEAAGASERAVRDALDVLVARGYVARDRSGPDRAVELTDRGHEVVAAVWRGTEAIDAELATRLSAGQIETMRSGLMALADIKATLAAPEGRRRRRRQLRQFSPIFPVRELAPALAHYAALGFTTSAYEEGEDYGFADRDGVGLHLARDPGRGAGSAYLYVRDADALFAEWSRPGIAGVTHPVGPMPYGLREGSHVDPDGNLIRFGSPDEADEGAE
jgi:catechol 2,3-dioxygenase-like lactoylglutathione lyase family enzyme